MEERRPSSHEDRPADDFHKEYRSRSPRRRDSWTRLSRRSRSRSRSSSWEDNARRDRREQYDENYRGRSGGKERPQRRGNWRQDRRGRGNTRRSSEESGDFQIVIDNLGTDATTDHIYEIFGVYGDIIDVSFGRSIRHPDERGVSACYVTYHSLEQARMACSHMDGGMIDRLDISVEMNTGRFGGRRRRNFNGGYEGEQEERYRRNGRLSSRLEQQGLVEEDQREYRSRSPRRASPSASGIGTSGDANMDY